MHKFSKKVVRKIFVAKVFVRRQKRVCRILRRKVRVLFRAGHKRAARRVRKIIRHKRKLVRKARRFYKKKS